jgi:hypothetical protein
MFAVLILALAVGDAVTEAGTAYREALDAVKAENYEGAIQLLSGAIQRVGEETDVLKYRDSTARRLLPYYPYYEWGCTRELQAKKETSILTRRDLLKDAVTRLGQTRHPDGPRLLEDVKKQLAEVEKAIALDGSFASTKTKIEVLGTGERFEEALKQLDEATRIYPARQKEIADLRASLLERQKAVEKKYEQVLFQRLGDVVLADPIVAGESIQGFLKAAQIPADTVAKPGPAFGWLQRFMELCEKSLETTRKSADLSAAEINAIAEPFEALGLDAFAAGVSPGFRAARHIAHSVRLAKLNRIASGAEDVIDTQTVDAIVGAAAKTAEKAADGVAKLPESDSMAKTLEADVPARQKQLDDLSKQIHAGAKERARLTAPIVVAETSLSDGNTLGDVKKLAEVIAALAELESEANFGTLTNRLRARALLSHGIAEAYLAFLEGNPAARVIDRCRLPAWRAYGFDRKVDDRWAGKLSPKMLKILEQIKPQ